MFSSQCYFSKWTATAIKSAVLWQDGASFRFLFHYTKGKHRVNSAHGVQLTRHFLRFYVRFPEWVFSVRQETEGVMREKSRHVGVTTDVTIDVILETKSQYFSLTRCDFCWLFLNVSVLLLIKKNICLL